MSLGLCQCQCCYKRKNEGSIYATLNLLDPNPIEESELSKLRKQNKFLIDTLDQIVAAAMLKRLRIATDALEVVRESKDSVVPDKGVIHTNTAIGFEKLNEEILKSQKEELKTILTRDRVECLCNDFHHSYSCPIHGDK